MNCDAFRVLITREIDGVLDGTGRGALDSHVAACPACARERTAQGRIHEAFSQLRDVDVPAGLAERIAERAAAAPAPLLRFPRWQSLAPIAASILALCMLSGWLGHRLASEGREVLAGPRPTAVSDAELRQLLIERIGVPADRADKIIDLRHGEFDPKREAARAQFDARIRQLVQDELAAIWNQLTPDEQRTYRQVDPSFEPPPKLGR